MCFQGTVVTPNRALGHSGLCLQNVNGLRTFLDQIVQSLGLLFKRLGADLGKPLLNFQFHLTRCS